MPRKPIDYTNTHFYRIVCKDTSINDCYIGHTTDFKRRKSEHKKHCYMENDKHYNLKLYKFIRDNGGWDNFDMILINTECCDGVLEARRREREHIEQHNSSLNHTIPSRSSNEYLEANKERFQKYRQEYYEQNKPEISEKRKIYRDNHKEEKALMDKKYRENNKEKLKVKQQEYYEQNKESVKAKVKEYAENNKDKRKERDIKYRENNKELIQQKKKDYREKNSNIIICDCGTSFKKYNLWCHNKSKRHQDYIN